MRIAPALIAFACLSGCAAANPPPPVPPPAVVDINSEEFKKELADERSAALRKASEQPTNVTRQFVVGWEMHSGYYLNPVEASDVWVNPDFLDERVKAKFDTFIQPGRVYRAGETIPFIGKRVVCTCTGVEWSFYEQKRFLVREARLELAD